MKSVAFALATLSLAIVGCEKRPIPTFKTVTPIDVEAPVERPEPIRKTEWIIKREQDEDGRGISSAWPKGEITVEAIEDLRKLDGQYETGFYT
jgi:hypothetical protein